MLYLQVESVFSPHIRQAVPWCPVSLPFHSSSWSRRSQSGPETLPQKWGALRRLPPLRHRLGGEPVVWPTLCWEYRASPAVGPFWVLRGHARRGQMVFAVTILNQQLWLMCSSSLKAELKPMFSRPLHFPLVFTLPLFCFSHLSSFCSLFTLLSLLSSGSHLPPEQSRGRAGHLG